MASIIKISVLQDIYGGLISHFMVLNDPSELNFMVFNGLTEHTIIKIDYKLGV